jgi:indole-3-glycerol phosphate synthase
MLKKILETKRAEVEFLKNNLSIETCLSEGKSYDRRSFYDALAKEELSLIAEIKRASPSKGILRDDFNPLEIAQAYLRHNNPSAFSVLTDEVYFKGHARYLKDIKMTFDLPVLRKDFIIDSIQVYESFQIGADAILLISEALEKNKLHDLYHLAYSLDLDVLVEVHSPDSLSKLEGLDVKILGVNNRNLDDFSVDLNQCVKIREIYEKDFGPALFVSESGILSKDDYQFVEDAQFDGVLIGEGLVKGLS